MFFCSREWELLKTTTGTVGGRRVVFKSGGSRLEWQDQESSETRSIRHEHMLAILAKGKNEDEEIPDDYPMTVLFLEECKPTEDPGDKSEHLRLRSLTASNLPCMEYLVYRLPATPPHLLVPPSQDGHSNIHVIISTLSGDGGAMSYFSESLKPLLSQIGDIDYQTHETKSKQMILDLARTVFVPRAREGISQTIILLSDGAGISDVINALFDERDEGAQMTPLTIALIPMGTITARRDSTGLLSDPAVGLLTLLRGSPRPLPIFRATISSPNARSTGDEAGCQERVRATSASKENPQPNTHIYGTAVASWGLHASLVEDSNTAEYLKFGVDRFRQAAKGLIYPPDGTPTHRYRGKITLIKRDNSHGEDCHQILDRREHMYVIATLVSDLDIGFTVSPRSRPLDGQFRVVHSGPLPPDEAMGLLTDQGGLDADHESVCCEDVEAIKIEFDEEDERWRRICVDGTIVTIAQGGQVEVRREKKHPVRLVTMFPE